MEDPHNDLDLIMGDIKIAQTDHKVAEGSKVAQVEEVQAGEEGSDDPNSSSQVRTQSECRDHED